MKIIWYKIENLPVNVNVLSISAASLRSSLFCAHSPLHKCVRVRSHWAGAHTDTHSHTTQGRCVHLTALRRSKGSG